MVLVSLYLSSNVILSSRVVLVTEPTSTSRSSTKMAKKVSPFNCMVCDFVTNYPSEYDDDTAIIPRSTTVIARRLPAIKKGAGKAHRYMTGKMPVNAKNSSRKEQASKALKPAASTNGLAQMNSAMTEEQRMAAMFQAQSEQWDAQQEEMAK
jgi:hypothetical protein